ncbi:hypothetical protein LINGRAHAP2_LOCUS12458, partial [Linum grandiflorum]
ELLDRDWTIKVEHIYQEGIRVADFLASRDHSLHIGVHSIPINDPTLSLYILYDLFGILQPGLIENKR